MQRAELQQNAGASPRDRRVAGKHVPELATRAGLDNVPGLDCAPENAEVVEMRVVGR